MGTLFLVRFSHQGANAGTAGDKITASSELRFYRSSSLESLDHSSKTSSFSGHAQTTLACLAAVPRRTIVACFDRATRKIKVLTTSLLNLSKNTASILTGAFTHATERRFGALLPPHAQFGAKSKAYFTKRLPDTKVNYICEGDVFASVSFVTGAGLTRKLGTLYGSVAAVLESDGTANAEDVNVVLGTTSNNVTRVYPAYIAAVEIGKSHAVIRLASEVTDEWKEHFPHGPEFLPPAAPALTAHCHGDNAALHVVAIVPVAHPNAFGVDDVASGKIGEATIQAFGDAHGSRGTNWLSATMKFSPAAHAAIVESRAALAAILPTITPARLLDVRPTKVALNEDNATRLDEGVEALDKRLASAQSAHAAASGGGVPEMIGNNLSQTDGVIAPLLPALTDGTAASVAKRQKVERLAGMMAMFAHLDSAGRAAPPVVSVAGQIVLDAGSKTDASRAYNEALVATVEAMAKPEATHYLGRAATIPGEGGYTEFMASCFVHCHYRGTSLQSIGEAARVKTGASVVYHIPHLDAGMEADGQSENTGRTNAMLMGEVPQNLSAVVCSVKVNEMYGSYPDILGLLGNIWLQQQVIFQQEPKSALTLFVEVLGDTVCAPHIKRWLLRSLPKKPEIAYAVLNYCEQAYLLVTGMARKRGQTKLIATPNWDAVDPSAYEQVADLAIVAANKLDAAARGGESFTACAMWENSVRAASIKRAADTKRNAELLAIKHATEARGRRGGPVQDRERENTHADKKSRAETKKEAHHAKSAAATEADKAGDIVGHGYLKCPTVAGPKQHCGAFHRKGVACAKWLATGKCERLHVLINDDTKPNQLLWFDIIGTQPNFDFNADAVTCFEVVAGKFVRPP
jgi:hypothetical protein